MHHPPRGAGSGYQDAQVAGGVAGGLDFGHGRVRGYGGRFGVRFDEITDPQVAQVQASDSWAEYPASRAPTLAECSTRWRSASGSCPASTWSADSTPTLRRHQFADSFSPRSDGRVSRMKPRIGSASSVADRSGCAMAQDLGANSPTTRCRNVTMISAGAKAAASASHSGAFHELIRE